MPDIQITVRNKIAQLQGAPQIVCGNSDYTAAFEFDSGWDAYDEKTVRIVWRDITTGKFRKPDDILLTGSSCALPPVYNANFVLIGVYAGDIRTSTPARVSCLRCITDDAPVHDPPADDIYAQLLEYLAGLEPSGGSDGFVIGSAFPSTVGGMRFTIGSAERVTTQIDLTEYGLAECSFNDNTGELSTAAGTGKIGTFDAVTIPDIAVAVQISAVTTAQQNLEWFCYLYDESGNYLSSESSAYYGGNRPYDWKAASDVQQIPPAAKSMRFGFRISSRLPALTPDDISSAAAIF